MFVAPSKRNGFKERSYRAVLGSWEVFGVSSERSAGWQDEDEDAEMKTLRNNEGERYCSETTVDHNSFDASGRGTASKVMPIFLIVPLVENNAGLRNFGCTIAFHPFSLM
ncbi:hypothetical protein TURU_152218 [Turdus rufiventris]|nr:hypothetical protein TURU_152218 [Turdus rufiventris]